MVAWWYYTGHTGLGLPTLLYAAALSARHPHAARRAPLAARSAQLASGRPFGNPGPVQLPQWAAANLAGAATASRSALSPMCRMYAGSSSPLCAPHACLPVARWLSRARVVPLRKVVVAAQLVTFVWSVAGGRRVAAVAPAAHIAATAGRPVATKCAHADLTFLLVSSGTCDCCKPPAIFVLPDEHCRFRTRRRPKSASRLCHHHQSHLVSSSRVAIERESSELVAPTFRAIFHALR